MRFEGILKEYLEAVATGFNRSGCRRFIHPKRGGNRNRGPVSGLFPVHATGPLNTTHRPNWQVQSGVVRRNMPCSGGLPGFGPDFSVNQVHWTPLDSTGFQQLHWTPADSAGFHGLQWILLDSGGLCMTSLFNY